MKLWCATTNVGKLREFCLAGTEVLPLPNLAAVKAPAETGTTFEENAALKAAFYSQLAEGLLFADDSGLEVDALGGDPGIHSARFAGEKADAQANCELLLQRMEGVRNRKARFVCVLAIARGGVVLNSFRGEIYGEIALEYCGDGGFGYDPLFIYPPFCATLADLDETKKFHVSHRGNAFRAMQNWLENAPKLL